MALQRHQMRFLGYLFVSPQGYPKHAVDGESEACRHTGRYLAAVAGVVGSRELAAVALVSCSHHAQVDGALQEAVEASRRHRLVKERRYRHRHHFHRQMAQVRSSMPTCI